MFLNKIIIQNIKKYIPLRNRTNILKTLPKEILFSILKYNLENLLEYLQNDLNINWKSFYYYLYRETEVYSFYIHPKKYNNIWINAIINRTCRKNKDVNYKLLNNNTIAYTYHGSKKTEYKLIVDSYGKTLKNVVKFFTIPNSTIFLLKDGSVVVNGSNTSGQLGLGHKNHTTESKYEFVYDKSGKLIKNVIHIVYVKESVYLLFKTGEVMVCGNNLCGQLGLGDFFDRTHFELITDRNGNPINNAINIFCRDSYSFILLKTGKIMVTGGDLQGKLGIDSISTIKFQLICDKFNNVINNVSNIFLFENCIFLLLSDGTIMACGENDRGQLGLGHNTNIYIFELIPNVKNVVNIFCKYIYTILLLKNGKIMCSGNNQFGQLGFPNKKNLSKFRFIQNLFCENIKNVINIFSTHKILILLLQGGSIMVCGKNDGCSLGTGDKKDVKIFKSITDSQKKLIKNVISIFIGVDAIILLLKSGKIMVCGINYSGRLGLGFEK